MFYSLLKLVDIGVKSLRYDVLFSSLVSSFFSMRAFT